LPEASKKIWTAQTLKDGAYTLLRKARNCLPVDEALYDGRPLTLWRWNFLLNFSTPCILNVNITGTKKGSIMK
jgi:hypothetical protein